MQGFDATSVAQSIPAPQGQVWSIDEVAVLQSALTEIADTTADGSADAVAALVPGTTVSGRYRSAGAVEIELRVDLDGARPTRRVSGDFYRRSGSTLAYTGSFIVNAPTITLGQQQVVVEGEGVFSFAANSPVMRLIIPRTPATSARAPIQVQFLTTSGVPGSTHSCAFQSSAFRTVEWEQDIVADVTPFATYDTASFPHPGRARRLSVPLAFAEAGVEFLDTRATNKVSAQLSGADRVWSNRELHAAMTRNFSRASTMPAWRVYLLAATSHERPRTRGIMFDSDRRQGCAIFHDLTGSGASTDAEVQRSMLRTYVHELGHCFNLYHSHMKDLMHPPRPNRLDALSWMHYPQNYVGPAGSGPAAYWRAFPFQFDDEELVHLRHGFRNDIVPGGRPFGQGASDIDPEAFAEPVVNESGLALEIRGPAQFMLGAPVVIEFRLSLTDLRGRVVNALIHPNHGFTQLGIARLGGRPVVFRPMMTQCADPELVELGHGDPAIYASAYVGYGRDGFYFDSPGTYELRALYTAPDGSRIMSNALRVRIAAPLDRQEDELAQLFSGDQQGALFFLLGSSAPTLEAGNAAFQEALDKYPSHPLTTFIKLTEGMSSALPFKQLDDGQILMKDPDYTLAERKLAEVVDATTGGPEVTWEGAAPIGSVPRLDNITLNMAVRRLARVRARNGDLQAARDTADQLLGFLAKQGVKNTVQASVREQLDSLVTKLADNADEGALPPPEQRARPARGSANRPRKPPAER
jgi:hypothetical protein